MAASAKPRSQPKYALNKNKYLLPPEYERLEELLWQLLPKDSRNCVLLLLALRTGARAQELLNLELSDLNPYDETVYIRGIKGSNDREIPIPPKLFRELYKYSQAITGSTKMFPISYQRLNQVWDLYRTAPKKFHSLRHTFAIRLYQKTKDIRLVQVALGHRNITNTMIYADYVYSQQELKKLIL
jgi:integrase